MPKKSNQTSKAGRRHGYRRPWWKRIFRRSPNEDMVEYVSRLVVVPLLIVTAALLFGLTIEPSQRKEYLESLMSPAAWIGEVFSDSGEQAEASPVRTITPVTVAPAVTVPEPLQTDSVGADTSSQTLDATSDAQPASTGPTGGTPDDQGAWYVVKEGQTLHDIARTQYGDVSQWKRIWFYNLERLPRPNSVKFGMEIFLPGPGDLSQAEAARVDELMNSRP